MIKNISKDKIVAEDYKLCTSFFSKLKGLMFSRQSNQNRKNLVFVFSKEKRISLKMWFVFYPIDVVLLDSNKKVVEIKEMFMPFSCFNSKNKARYVLELYCGAVKEGKIKEGDKISFLHL